MIGQKVNNYEMTQLLGEGGMGAVYLAEHPFLGRKAAIKILKPECASNSDYVQRFLNEARAANAIHHPNIIDIIDVGLLPDGVPYMMMEFLQGESLAERIRRVVRLPIGEATFVATQIASALAAAHAASIIHRDLKPDNVFVVPDPQNPGQEHIKVLDFGIAKLRPEFAPSTPRTSAGALMGTPAYMSPEQCMGKTSEIDHRADIYALGIILFEMLCGQLPFMGQAFGEYFLQHITAPPPQPRDLNPEIPFHIEAVILKAMAKAPQDRIQTMEAFADALTGKSVPATLVLDGAPGGLGSARSVAQTVSLPSDEDPLSFPSRPKHRSEPRLRRTPRFAEDDSPPMTTLSSSSGHVRMRTGNMGREQSGRRTAVIVGVVIALCGAAAAGVIALSGHTTSQVKDDSESRQRAADPIPPFTPPPTELPPLPTRPEPPAKAPRAALEANEQPESEPGETQPSGKTPASGRERGKGRTGSHGERSSKSGGHHEQAGSYASAPSTPAPPPTVIPSTVPPPVNPSPAPKVITREKF